MKVTLLHGQLCPKPYGFLVGFHWTSDDWPLCWSIYKCRVRLQDWLHSGDEFPIAFKVNYMSEDLLPVMVTSRFFICWITLGRVSKCGDPKKIKMKNCRTFMSVISVEHMLINLEVNFSPKHQLICNYYHPKGLYQFFYVNNKSDNHLQHFANFSCHFIFSFLFIILISKIQSAAGNIIQ